jgi:hypothetical protein
MRRPHARCATPPMGPSEPQTNTNPYVLRSSDYTNNYNSRFAPGHPQITCPALFCSPTQTRFLLMANPNQNKTLHNHQNPCSSIEVGECALVCSDARLYVSELLDVHSVGQKSSCSKDMCAVIKCWHDERMISNTRAARHATTSPPTHTSHPLEPTPTKSYLWGVASTTWEP